MRTLRQIAGGNDRRKYDVQNPPAKYWGTWTPQGQRRVVKRSDGSRSTDKTRGFHSRPTHKLGLRNANRSINKRARQMLKQQLNQEAFSLAAELLEAGKMNLQQPVRLKLADGSAVQGMFHGYWDMTPLGRGWVPAISYPLPDGSMTTGFLPQGAQILDPIMSAEEWQQQQQQQAT